MTLNVSVRKHLRYFDLDISFSCPAEELHVMIGPSGSGKTTILRMITGLDRPDEGLISYGDEVWFDSGRKLNLPPGKRRLGYVFQEYTLFPHLSLFENAAFAAASRQEVHGLLDLFGIGHLGERKPREVSGGERQRCAICQALARHPRLLLLDEPFSALDVLTRRKLRRDLKALKAKFSFPALYVTHDIGEALFLADEILPVVEGKIEKGWMKSMISRESMTGGDRHSERSEGLIRYPEKAAQGAW
jgi:molybdate transport system ATP-binding protein